MSEADFVPPAVRAEVYERDGGWNRPPACRIEGCDRQVNARGLCSGHYQRWRKQGIEGGPLKRYGRRRCEFPACTREAHAQALCNAHYQAYRRRLHITVEEFQERWRAQGGRCAICREPGVPPVGRLQTLCVDHDHSTGAIRGLLCSQCNAMLGMARDRPEVLEAGAAYLNAVRHG